MTDYTVSHDRRSSRLNTKTRLLRDVIPKGPSASLRVNSSTRNLKRAETRRDFSPPLRFGCSETKSATRTGHSWQPVIPGEQRETRNPGAKTWIPACAGMTARGRVPVSASLLSALRSGQLEMTTPCIHTVSCSRGKILSYSLLSRSISRVTARVSSSWVRRSVSAKLPALSSSLFISSDCKVRSSAFPQPSS